MAGIGEPPRRRHRTCLWTLLAAAFAVLVTGVATQLAPLIALGVVLAAAAGRAYERGRSDIR